MILSFSHPPAVWLTITSDIQCLHDLFWAIKESSQHWKGLPTSRETKGYLKKWKNEKLNETDFCFTVCSHQSCSPLWMYEILCRQLCLQIFYTVLSKAFSQPRCLTPKDTASYNNWERELKRIGINPGKIVLSLLLLTILTFHLSQLWSRLCPWQDTVFPGPTVLYTDAS